MHVVHVVAPDVTRMRPSGSVVAVGYHRRCDISGIAVHCCVDELNRLAFCRPMMPLAESWPPATSTRPSASVAVPVQKMLLVVLGVETSVLEAGSNTDACGAALSQPGYISTLPVF